MGQHLDNVPDFMHFALASARCTMAVLQVKQDKQKQDVVVLNLFIKEVSCCKQVLVEVLTSHARLPVDEVVFY
jgi:hypothetical protein